MLECDWHLAPLASRFAGAYHFRCGCLFNSGMVGGMAGWYRSLFPDERGRDERRERLEEIKARSVPIGPVH